VMAGVSGAAASWRESQRSLDVNVGGLTNVLDVAVGRAPDARIVFPSSRLVYGRSDALPVNEDAPLRPDSPYALHKIACEQLLALYRDRHGTRYAIARLTNPYGATRELPPQPYNVISAMIARARAGGELVVFGDGSQLRDYLYVEDAVESLIALGTFAEAQIVNVGSGEGTRFVDVVNTIVELAASGSVVFREWPAAYAAVESGDFVADLSRARELGLPRARGIVEGLRQSLAQ
jgi:UDP-glucose 4-epimerase